VKGKITSYLPEKAYGFIAGDDGHDYLFYKKNFSIAEHQQEITDGLSVQFDALPTPKGYRAESIKFEIEPVDLKFEVPAKVMMSNSNDVRGWQIVENGSWLISVESRDTIDEAKEKLCNRASILGANAILNCNFQEKIGSDPGTGNGTPIYTINCLTGRVANIGKRSVVGEYQLSDLTKLDEGIRAFLETKKNAEANRKRCISRITCDARSHESDMGLAYYYFVCRIHCRLPVHGMWLG